MHGMIPFRPLLLALCVAVGGCDSGSDSCGKVPDTAAPGSFQLRFEETGGCFTLQGTSARFGARPPQSSDSTTTYVQLFPDGGDEATEATTFAELLTVGGRPLPVGRYYVADLYARSSVRYAPPQGDARLVEYPGAVAIAVVIRRGEVLFSRGGTLTVSRSGPDGFAAQLDAELAAQQTSGGQDRPGATLRVRGAFNAEPGAGSFILVL